MQYKKYKNVLEILACSNPPPFLIDEVQKIFIKYFIYIKISQL
jgi:hypothetical protein